MKIGVYVEVSDPEKNTLELWRALEAALSDFDPNKMRLIYGCPDSHEIVSVEVQTKFSWCE